MHAICLIEIAMKNASDNLPRVVSSTDGIGSCDDGATSFQSCDNSGFRYGDGLLFHGLVNGRAVAVIHLVELVNQADALKQIQSQSE